MGNAHAQVGRSGVVGRHSVEVVKYLGEGGSSFIFLVKDTRNGQLYVLKRVVANDEPSMKLIKNEIEFQQRFRDSHVVEFVDYQENKERRETEVFILMEYCPGGHLYENMKKMGEKRFTQDQLLRTFRSLCLPIQLLHHNNPPVAHRDIKLENFLLAKDNTYKLCDFGSCVEGPRTLETKQDRIAEIDMVEKRTTAMYRSPELADIEGTAMFGSACLTEAVDIWALGCVLYNMAFFKPPFPPDGLRTSKYNVPANSYSKDLPLLLKRMLAEDVEERATIDEVIACIDAIMADEPLPKKGTVQTTNTTASRTSSGRKEASRTSSKPNVPVVDVMSAPTTAPAFANFADFSAPSSTPAAPTFDAFSAPTTTAPVAPLAPINTAFDPFGAPPAPANKVMDTFGFIVSPTNQPEKQTQARDAFSAFEDLNKPTPMPWEQSKAGNPMSPMGLHNMQSPMGYHQPAMNYGQPMSPMNYAQPNANYMQAPMPAPQGGQQNANGNWKATYDFKF